MAYMLRVVADESYQWNLNSDSDRAGTLEVKVNSIVIVVEYYRSSSQLVKSISMNDEE